MRMKTNAEPIAATPAARSMSLSHGDSRRAIDDHFAGRGAPAREAAMRAHTLQCAACRSYYERHLILARLDPAAAAAKDRLGRGLGLKLQARASTPRTFRWAAALALPATAIVLLLARPARVVTPPGVDTSSGTFVARSAGGVAAPEPGFWIYRVDSDGRPRLVQDEVRAADELAFAYGNPGGKPFVLVFGVDEHRHVYWFHPAWRRGQGPPSAVPAAPGPGPFELPEAIRHQLDGGRLVVRALFSRRALRADEIEAGVRGGAGWEAAPRFSDADAVEVVVRDLRVLP